MWFNDGLSGAERLLMPRLLAQGFAVASSSGNETGVHYNLRLAEETAMMTKEHFIEAYGPPGGTPAPRRSGDLSAMRAAYTSGHVFIGRRLDVPMIDLRPYLEPELNMHNSRQSFSVRARLLSANAQAANKQVIWFTGSDASCLAPYSTRWRSSTAA